MAGLNAVNSFGDSLMQFLGNAYPNELRADYPCDFRVVSSNELNGDADFGTAVTFYLYRLITDQYQRNSPRANNSRGQRPPLALDLHFMVSVWADSPAAEHAIAAWVMRQIYEYPIMDSSLLTLEGQWQAGEIVHVIPAEVSNVDLIYYTFMQH